MREDLTRARWPLVARPYLLETSIPGVFCVGDALHGVVRVASAVGEGAMACNSCIARYKSCERGLRGGEATRDLPPSPVFGRGPGRGQAA